MSDDLTSYYLLGYLSTNSKLDGRFRALKVKVKRPGIEVRARRGYRAATEAEVNTARRAADAPVPEATRAVSQAMDRLGRVRSDVRFRINAVSSAGSTPQLWVAGELQGSRPTGRVRAWWNGRDRSLRRLVVHNVKVPLKPGERTFLATMPLPAGATGELSIRARLVSTEAAPCPCRTSYESRPGPSGLQPLLFRRGVTTGNRMLPAANLQFSRTERLRLELPVVADAKPGSGRLLDRTGQPLQVPVTVGARLDEATSQRSITADVVLAALSGGDYAVEIEVVGTAKSERIVSAIRIVR